MAFAGPYYISGNTLLTRKAELAQALDLAQLDDPNLTYAAVESCTSQRFDRAREAAGDTTLLKLGGVPPAEVPFWINAANAVLVPSQAEGFGLSVIEALACGVPAFGTPVGIHRVALEGIEGTYCAPWGRDAWRAALRPVLEADDPPTELVCSAGQDHGRDAAPQLDRLAPASPHLFD